MSILIEGMEMPIDGNETIIIIQPDGTVLDQYGNHLAITAVPVSKHWDLINREGGYKPMTKLPDFDQTHILESLEEHLRLTQVDCPCSDCNYMFCPVTEEPYSCCFKHREWLNKIRSLEKLIRITANANLYFEGKREQNAGN